MKTLPLLLQSETCRSRQAVPPCHAAALCDSSSAIYALQPIPIWYNCQYSTHRSSVCVCFQEFCCVNWQHEIKMREFVGKVRTCAAKIQALIVEIISDLSSSACEQVISNRMMKTVLVAVSRLKLIAKYKRSIRRTKKFMVCSSAYPSYQHWDNLTVIKPSAFAGT